jgi:hypothetical protein
MEFLLWLTCSIVCAICVFVVIGITMAISHTLIGG